MAHLVLYALLIMVHTLHGSENEESKILTRSESTERLEAFLSCHYSREIELEDGMWGTFDLQAPPYNAQEPLPDPKKIKTPYWRSIKHASADEKNWALCQAICVNDICYKDWRYNVLNALQCGSDLVPVQKAFAYQSCLFSQSVAKDDLALVSLLFKKGARLHYGEAPVLPEAPSIAMAQLLVDNGALEDPQQTKEPCYQKFLAIKGHIQAILHKHNIRPECEWLPLAE